MHDRRQIFVGRFCWQTKLANFIVRLTSPLEVFGDVNFCNVCLLTYLNKTSVSLTISLLLLNSKYKTAAKYIKQLHETLRKSF